MLLVGAAVLISVTAILAAGAPALLSGRAWVFRHPRVGLALWLGALATGAVALVTALSCVLVSAVELANTPVTQSPSTCACITAAGTYVAGWILSALVGGLVVLGLYRAVMQTLRNHELRRDLGAALRTDAERRTVAGEEVLVCRHDLPFALSMPGHPALIAVSARLRDALDEDELAAVVAHERAHLTQRHAVLMQLAAVHRACLPRLHGAQALEGAVRTLVELAADDAAARRHGVAVAASALRKTAQADAEIGLRVRRLELRVASAVG